MDLLIRNTVANIPYPCHIEVICDLLLILIKIASTDLNYQREKLFVRSKYVSFGYTTDIIEIVGLGKKVIKNGVLIISWS